MGNDKVGLETQLARHWDRRHKDGGWITDRKTGEEKPPDRRFVEFLDAHEAQIGKKWLDAGCGPGRNATELARRGLDVVGVDFSSEAIEQARERFASLGLTATFEVGDLANLRFRNGEFDGVASLQVFSHLPGWEAAKQAFAELSRVLKLGGLFFLRTGSTTRPLPEDAEVVEEADHDLPPDQQGFTYTNHRHGLELTYHRHCLEELRWLASKNNLEIVGVPFEEKDREEDGTSIPGHWNIVFRKEVNE
ncbi:class I SAM-dependent methyltransferase [Candidatus Berkelbacteria bacterium]|nr:class I SAM-dependent methyltransferase [Candidatus Berkelbacteria bacterium]